ncbi:hypothetical protein KKB18_06470, partial [bacterium]|nr:hypothetical protein [bacterium]
HKKIAKAIVEGKALKIEGGVYEMVGLRKFRCSDCSQLWELPHGTGRPMDCPQCKSKNIHRADEDKGHSRMGKETACRGRYGRGNPPQNRKQ